MVFYRRSELVWTLKNVGRYRSALGSTIGEKLTPKRLSQNK